MPWDCRGMLQATITNTPTTFAAISIVTMTCLINYHIVPCAILARVCLFPSLRPLPQLRPI